MKTTLYYDLADKFQGEICPICSLLADRMSNCIDLFLYEKVNNGYLREEIWENHGFCSRHARDMMKFGDPLSHAQIYSDLLKNEISDFDKADFSSYDNLGNCYFCNEQERYENDICDSFALSLSEEEFCEKFSSSGSFLCNPHYAKVSESCDRQRLSYNKRLLARYEKEAIKIILSGLEEIKINHDYRNTGVVISVPAKVSWRKAVNLISGFESVEIKIKRR